MTCKEKLKLDQPEWNEDTIEHALGFECPSNYEYMKDPEVIDGDCSIDCCECWNREIPEELMEEVVEGLKNPAIKDSGERTKFSTGAQRDMHEGKGDMASVPWEAILRLSVHYENGAKKYDRWNFRKGIPVSSFIDSACRHLAKYQCGCDDEDHLAAAAFNVLGAMLMENTKPEMVDLPLRQGKNTFEYFKE